jgi:hypothetical protein
MAAAQLNDETTSSRHRVDASIFFAASYACPAFVQLKNTRAMAIDCLGETEITYCR